MDGEQMAQQNNGNRSQLRLSNKNKLNQLRDGLLLKNLQSLTKNQMAANLHAGVQRIVHQIVAQPRYNEKGQVQNIEEIVDHSYLRYQPVELRMEWHKVQDKFGKPYDALIQTRGLEPIQPDREFDQGILYDLMRARNCEFLICVAMYNEGPKEFNSTIEGIIKNLKVFKDKGIHPSRVACIIIVDGMRPFLQTYNENKNFFSQFFDEDAVKQRFGVTNLLDIEAQLDPLQEIAHLFSQDLSLPYLQDEEYLQLIMCIKQKNKRKLNTHLWFFGGFCEMIQPSYVMLLDIGTKSKSKALWHLYEAMVVDKNIAGTCGEIVPMEPQFWNAIEMVQTVEYKFSHIFDKPLESVFGFITVLPGAFSAYRWEALQGDPLWKNYFKSSTKPHLMDCYHSNIFLAEDRVLSLALLTKKKMQYTLRFVKAAVAETDVPDTLFKLLAQRRRWVNGSWFALIDSLREFNKIKKSGHSCQRKCCIYIEIVYFGINALFAWIAVGMFFLAFSILLRNAFPDQGEDDEIFDIGNAILVLYMTLLLIMFIMSLGVKPIHVKGIINLISAIFGLYMMSVIFFMIVFFIEYDGGWLILILALIPVVGFTIAIILYNAVCTILKGILHFLYLTPTYVNIFLIYSICNIHDCTWGNRPDQLKPEEKARLEEFEAYRTKWAIIWICCNSIFVYFINKLDKNMDRGFDYIASVGIISIFIFIMRFLGCIIYYCQESCCRKKFDKSLVSGLEAVTPSPNALPLYPQNESRVQMIEQGVYGSGSTNGEALHEQHIRFNVGVDSPNSKNAEALDESANNI